jgi:hypothetical protein
MVALSMAMDLNAFWGSTKEAGVLLLVEARSETKNVSLANAWKKSAFFFVCVGYWVAVLQLVEVIVVEEPFT